MFVPGLTAPRQRRVTGGGLAATTGTLTVDAAFGAAVGNGTVFELSPRLPAVHESAASVGNAPYASLQGCLNEALKHLLVPDDQLSLALVTQQRDYSLAAWPWLDRAARLVDVRALDALGTTYVPTHHQWEVREGGRGATLHFRQPFRFSSGSYSLRLDVLRPADTLIRVGGSWGDSTVGLVSESDECAVEEKDLTIVALAFAYRALRDRSSGATKAWYAGLYEEQVRMARGVRNYDTSADIDPTVSVATGVA